MGGREDTRTQSKEKGSIVEPDRPTKDKRRHWLEREGWGGGAPLSCCPHVVLFCLIRLITSIAFTDFYASAERWVL